MSISTVKKILGDPELFYTTQKFRLADIGIDVSGFGVSHVAFRTETLDEYIDVRDALEAHSSSNVENEWNGRRISKLLLRNPIPLGDGRDVSLIELIPPVHQNTYKMGLEHVGFVVGESLEEFAAQHSDHFTGRQDQGPFCQPFYIAFPDHTNVKFYEHSLHDVCVLEGKTFDGFHHV
ncbi:MULTISPECIES: VOC family protein [Streptomyces]|uniref:VOC family protein n=1 Tax=Streptomyces heilongjiangensis TaxID=945052 RepID=A0ABW1BB60_9ACTN|nr:MULTISPECIES: VOC family protein [Streptomyces]MDC2951155.1 VOC family protein [Streptomyces heilongjiangensis]